MSFKKNECLRLKGITEPLEDIIIRHYGEDWKIKYNKILSKSKNDEKLTIEEANLKSLVNSLFEIKKVIDLNWDILIHQNDSLDV